MPLYHINFVINGIRIHFALGIWINNFNQNGRLRIYNIITDCRRQRRRLILYRTSELSQIILRPTRTLIPKQPVYLNMEGSGIWDGSEKWVGRFLWDAVRVVALRQEQISHLLSQETHTILTIVNRCEYDHKLQQLLNISELVMLVLCDVLYLCNRSEILSIW